MTTRSDTYMFGKTSQHVHMCQLRLLPLQPATTAPSFRIPGWHTVRCIIGCREEACAGTAVLAAIGQRSTTPGLDLLGLGQQTEALEVLGQCLGRRLCTHTCTASAGSLNLRHASLNVTLHEARGVAHANERTWHEASVVTAAYAPAFAQADGVQYLQGQGHCQGRPRAMAT